MLPLSKRSTNQIQRYSGIHLEKTLQITVRSFWDNKMHLVFHKLVESMPGRVHAYTGAERATHKTLRHAEIQGRFSKIKHFPQTFKLTLSFIMKKRKSKRRSLWTHMHMHLLLGQLRAIMCSLYETRKWMVMNLPVAQLNVLIWGKEDALSSEAPVDILHRNILG